MFELAWRHADVDELDRYYGDEVEYKPRREVALCDAPVVQHDLSRFEITCLKFYLYIYLFISANPC